MLAASALLVAACSDGVASAPDPTGSPTGRPATAAPAPPVQPTTTGLPPAPPVPDGPLADATVAALDRLTTRTDPRDDDLATIRATGDPRVAWPLVDVLRFEGPSPLGEEIEAALGDLLGWSPPPGTIPWVAVSDALLVWDVPAPPGYLDWKAAAHRSFDARWDPFFDPQGDLDWRKVTWGGVPYDGITSIDGPAVETVDEVRWLSADDVVFAVEVEGEARAYPRRILEVHEMVNDTVGGTRLAIPYCTLCGTAVAYRTGGVAEVDGGTLTLATSGLLLRSNKLMFDRGTESLFDQFAGVAVTGPLRGLELERVLLTTTTWREWADANPGGTVIRRPLEPSAVGDPYDGTFLAGRPNQPIFPVGEVDDRLLPHELVLGVVGPEGPVAFVADEARDRLRAGEAVEEAGVVLTLVDGGLVARGGDGAALLGQEAFWFAWEQRQPDTALWAP